ncbi:hypothetical protein [Actinacidiphila yeochonensis]|uniref:hypothetical protein n=1 Tax=Actinacidiphila yeochonensis TaxID=89050 RepID=UPI0005623E06|nr:hypothetical protein [Actinacidiphila yeochonensis]
MRVLTASWAAWVSAFELRCKQLPGDPDDTSGACPDCGAEALRLSFSGLERDRVGYASFWCDACLVGIHLSRCLVPEGASMESLHTPVEERSVRVPDYTLLWPDEPPADE